MRCLLKGAIALSMAVLLLIASNATVLASFFFEVGRSKIAAELCVKKDMAENDCHGMCQLRRVLEERNDAEESPFFQNINELPEAILPDVLEAQIFFVENLLVTSYLSIRYQWQVPPLFKPPCA